MVLFLLLLEMKVNGENISDGMMEKPNREK